MELWAALFIASVLCLIESNSCKKREKIWLAIADLADEIERLKGEKP